MYCHPETIKLLNKVVFSIKAKKNKTTDIIIRAIVDGHPIQKYCLLGIKAALIQMYGHPKKSKLKLNF